MFVSRRFLGVVVGITGKGIDSLRGALEMALFPQKPLKVLKDILLTLKKS